MQFYYWWLIKAYVVLDIWQNWQDVINQHYKWKDSVQFKIFQKSESSEYTLEEEH